MIQYYTNKHGWNSREGDVLPRRDIQIVMGRGQQGGGGTTRTGEYYGDRKAWANDSGRNSICGLLCYQWTGHWRELIPKHKATWISPNSTTEKQIWSKLFLGMRIKGGTDIDPDHHLLMGELKLKLAAKTRVRSRAQRWFNITKLRDPQVKQDEDSHWKRDFLHKQEMLN